MKILISTAVALTSFAAIPASAADSRKEYLEAQRKAKVECALVRDYGRTLQSSYPKPHGTWGTWKSVDVACIDLVVESYVEVNEKKIRADELTGRFMGLQRQEAHRDLCSMSLIQEMNWSIWTTYQNKFGRKITTTKVSKSSCKEYGFPRVAQS